MVNIVIFGETGAGKSSVINLMAGREVARASAGTEPCTLQWTEYTISFGNGTRYQVFDTVGLQDPCLDSGEYLTAITNADSLVKTLNERGGIDLLLFCIRGDRVTATMQSGYGLFFEFFCQEKVPLALVITGLEREHRDMEDWYTRNEGFFKKYDIHSVGHACITATVGDYGEHRARYEESRRRVCSLVKAHCNPSAEGWTGRQAWGEGLITLLRDLAAGRPQKTDVVKVLTKRCGMPIEDDQQLSQQIWRGDKPDLAYGNDRKITPGVTQSGAPMSKTQGVTQQETQPESPTPSYLNVRLDRAPDMRTQKLRQQYLSSSDAELAIGRVMHSHIENFPRRLFDTTTGLLHDRDAQIDAFKTSTQYKELLSLTIKHADRRSERIEEAILTYFRYAMLSHRWEGKEPLLHNIQDKVVYQLEPVGGVHKLQSFCKVVRDAGYRWAWSDTCCIDKTNNVELQESVNTMFVWYRHSALTIIYLSDVSRSSKSGALAESAWNKRGWTVQEFLAPNVVIFYQKDWSLYLDDRTPNHKESVTIMQELAHATGIDLPALVNFQPGMRGAREKLQWASRRVTTWQEDIAYSLFGIFGLHLAVIYGEKKQNALGRLLQEIIARSGDITALDWVGKSSEFNSCLPADITSYEAPPFAPSSPSEREIQTTISSLRNTAAVELALSLYTRLHDTTAPRFGNCRLHLPCIVFPVTEVKRVQDQATYSTYEVKTEALNDLRITTEDKLDQSLPGGRTPQSFLLVRPWDRSLLQLPDFADSNIQSVDLRTLPGSLLSNLLAWIPTGYKSDGSEAHLRALILIAHLRQPFASFLLVQQWGGEHKRVASDHRIIAQVKDEVSVRDMKDLKTLEIL